MLPFFRNFNIISNQVVLSWLARPSENSWYGSSDSTSSNASKFSRHFESQQAIVTVSDQAQLTITRLLLAHFEAHPEDVAPLAAMCDQPTLNEDTQETHLAFATFLAPVI